MKTKEQIKNDYAVSKGFTTIIDIINECIIEHDHERILETINDISIISQRECLKLASENAIIDGNMFSRCGCELDKESITDENNIIK